MTTKTKTKKKFSEDDIRLSKLIERRNLSDSAIKNYNTVFNEIYDLFGVTPSDIVRMAKREQKPFKDKETGEYDIIELEDRTITQYQFDYYKDLKDKNLSNKTIKLKLDTFRALFKEYNIEKPNPQKIDIQTDRVRDEDIVSWREVETAMSFCKSIRDKAIISFLATSGLRKSDLIKLKIKDLICACNIYFDDNEEKTIDNLLSKDAENIIPCWEFMPSKTIRKSHICVTFNTPESSVYIWQYLNDRIKKDENGILGNEEPLFATSTKKSLHSTTIEQLFQRLNKRLGDKSDKNGKYGRFRAHSLRKLFSTTCRRNITQVVVNSDKTSEIDIVSIFTGHVPPNKSNSDVYEAIETDSHDSYLRKTYLALIPYLSIKDIEIKDIKTEQYMDLEEQNMILQEKLDAQGVLMQRELDEQREAYEKKIRALESVNSALSTQVNDIQKQIDDMANANNINKIQEYIVDNEKVNEYDLSDKVMELYRSDIEENNSIIVTTSYIDTLITRAYNMASGSILNGHKGAGGELAKNEEFIEIKQKIFSYKSVIIRSHNYMLTDSQEKLLDNELEEYSIDLWWKHEKDFDKKHVRDLVKKIATEGKL